MSRNRDCGSVSTRNVTCVGFSVPPNLKKYIVIQAQSRPGHSRYNRACLHIGEGSPGSAGLTGWDLKQPKDCIKRS